MKLCRSMPLAHNVWPRMSPVNRVIIVGRRLVAVTVLCLRFMLQLRRRWEMALAHECSILRRGYLLGLEGLMFIFIFLIFDWELWPKKWLVVLRLLLILLRASRWTRSLVREMVVVSSTNVVTAWGYLLHGSSLCDPCLLEALELLELQGLNLLLCIE